MKSELEIHRVGIIIQARMGSTRLPNKMKVLYGRYLNIELLMERLKKVSRHPIIILATSCLQADKELEAICHNSGVNYFCGSSEDVLSRFARCAREYNLTHVGRVTGDCPLIDPLLLDLMIEKALNDNLDFISNCRPPSYADGMDFDFFRTELLELADLNSVLPSEKEHVVGYLKNKLKDYNFYNFTNPDGNESDVRLTLDTSEDYDTLNLLISKLNDPIGANYREIIEVWKNLKNGGQISNLAATRNAGSLSSVSKDEVFTAWSLDKTNAFFKDAQILIPGGCQTFSKSNANYPDTVSPFIIDSSKGAYITDLDGNRYLDMVMGLGAVTIGYSDPRIEKSVVNQLGKGVSASFSFEIEKKYAEKIVKHIPCAEKIRFGKNGTDVTSAAVRLSRAVTGKNHIMVCGYHGWQDFYIGVTNRSQGVPEAVKTLTHKFKYNDWDGFVAQATALLPDLACVILEPVQYEDPRDNFLTNLRAWTQKSGVVLIFDEMVSGFRMAIGGGQSYFNVVPDLATFGKGCANGFPLSFLAGKRELMSEFEGNVFFSGTYGGEALSLSAANTVIDLFESENVIEHFKILGSLFMSEGEKIIRHFGFQSFLNFKGFCPHNVLSVQDLGEGSAQEIRTLIKQEVIRHGVIMGGAHNFSLSHTENDVLFALDAFYAALRTLKKALSEGKVSGYIKGGMLKEGLR